jgi:hypothetical protein
MKALKWLRRKPLISAEAKMRVKALIAGAVF